MSFQQHPKAKPKANSHFQRKSNKFVASHLRVDMLRWTGSVSMPKSNTAAVPQVIPVMSPKSSCSISNAVLLCPLAHDPQDGVDLWVVAII
mmetsp:Transcript_11547/g.20518  ORF Transcript_11547/g.20518 Transcript_11547/m.20518 type:complete len:91 (-) Transcript_11547:1664-1936(-)